MTILSLLNCLSFLVEKSISHRWLALFLNSRGHSFDPCLDYCSFLLSFNMKICESSTFILICQDDFGRFRPLHFHMNLKISLSFLDTLECVKMIAGAHRRLKNKTCKTHRKPEKRSSGCPGHDVMASPHHLWTDSNCSFVVALHSPVPKSWCGCPAGQVQFPCLSSHYLGKGEQAHFSFRLWYQELGLCIRWQVFTIFLIIFTTSKWG